MKPSFKTGLSFGLTSGVITTLGLMVGLHSGTHSRTVVIGGILTIAVADAMSDALGMHIAEESKNSEPAGAVWESTIATFVAKLIIALTFAMPVILMPLTPAIVVNVAWGLFLLAILSFLLARDQRIAPWKVIGEHVLIGAVVVGLSHLLGDWIRETLT